MSLGVLKTLGHLVILTCALAVTAGCSETTKPGNELTQLLSSESIDLKSARREMARTMADTIPFDFDFSLQDVAGEPIRKSDFAGKLLIVDIWGTWCPPCRDEIPHFIALYQRYRPDGLEIVGLNQENGSPEAQAQKVREFQKKLGINYRCAIITEKVRSQVPKFDGFPTTLFFDRKGNLRLHLVGYHEARDLQAAVENLLHEK